MLKSPSFFLLFTLICCSHLFADGSNSSTSSSTSTAAPSQKPPNTSNAIHSRAQAEQFEDPATYKCEEGEVYRDGHCEPISSIDVEKK